MGDNFGNEEELDSLGSEEGAQPKHARDSTYYAWSTSINSTKEELKRLGIDTAPKPVSSGSSIIGEEKAVVIGSAWNKSGTWEERDVSSIATKLLNDTLSLGECVVDDVIVRVKEVKKLEGRVTLVYSRVSNVKSKCAVRVLTSNVFNHYSG